MKNKFKIISILVCVIVCMFALTACAPGPGAPEYDTSAPNYAISESELQSEFDLFITGREDRTSFTAAEMNAALYLQSRLIEFGYNDVALQEFKTSEGGTNNLESQNVVARYASGEGDDVKHVVIGAYYDNRYSSAYKNDTEYRSAGALANGTGVATLLCIANYFMQSKPELGFDITFVFFGGSFVTDAGSRAFLRDGLTKTERENTVLMVELQRLGVDHVYAFSDERKTEREAFFDSVAQNNALDIYKPTQKSPIIPGVSSLEGVTYYRWAHNGLFSPFFESGIPTLNLVGANWETIDFTDTESSVNANIACTSEDNADTLKRLYPDYAQKMATAATLVIRSVEDEAFLRTLSADRENFPDTSVLNKSWIWSLVVVGALLLGGVALYFVYAHITKKYPRTIVAPPKMKMAVFGMDYEDKSASDIFIDIRRADGDDIFPGIPNNDNSAQQSPFDDNFPPLDSEPKNDGDGKNDNK